MVTRLPKQCRIEGLGTEQESVLPVLEPVLDLSDHTS